MHTVHDGTPNINKKNVINVKCINCKYGQPTVVYDFTIDENIEIIYCNATEEYIEMETAENDNLGCDLYVDDRNDDTAKKS